MATINQLNKQIATANARIADMASKVAMYQKRAENALVKLIKATGNKNLTLDNYDEITGRDERYYWDWCRVDSAIEYKHENEMKINREQHHITKLKEELAKLIEQEKNNATNEVLKDVLAMQLDGFKTMWIKRMVTWHKDHFDHIKNITPLAKTRKDRAWNIASYYQYRRHGRRRYYFAENIKKQAAQIIMDDANKFENIESYIAHIEDCLNKDWFAGIEKLTKKCQSFNIDESKIQTDGVSMTEKGIEVVITDGKQRRIYARVIWAAEYSLIVTPHTRYIVTERTNK